LFAETAEALLPPASMASIYGMKFRYMPELPPARHGAAADGFRPSG
jgi:Mg2+ and Co2+ transporter CorA